MIHPYNFSRVTALLQATQVPQNWHLQNDDTHSIQMLTVGTWSARWLKHNVTLLQFAAHIYIHTC